MADNLKSTNDERKMYLFNFQSFIEELRNNNEKKQLVEDYEKHVLKGKKIKGDVKDQIWYKNYLSKFTPVPKFMVPEELQNDFDWNLLFQLVAGSFSTKYRLAFTSSIPELIIWVQSGEIAIEKKVSELWSFQIQRLYEIYCEEFINLEVLINTNEDDKKGIKKEMNKILKNFSKKVNPPAPKIEKKHKSDKGESDNKYVVYFYCSLDSAYHILKSGKMFASDLVYMNDKEELTFGIDVMMEALQTIMEDKSNVYDSSLKKWLKNEFLNKQNEERFKKELESDHLYIACFSHERDSLNQWRAYGDNGFGVCIKFDFNITLHDSLSDDFYMKDVIYIDKSRIEKRKGIRLDRRKKYWIDELKYFENVFKGIIQAYNSTNNFSIPDELRRHLRYYKNNSFREERELRQICLNENNKYSPKTRVDKKKGYLIPYIELTLGNVKKETSIIEIITGPAVNPQKAKRSIEELFKEIKADPDPKKAFDYSHVVISHSTIPYLP